MTGSRRWAIAIAIVLSPSLTSGQSDAFVQAVRELADTVAAGQVITADRLAAAERMAAALVAWDRQIAALEARVTRDLSGAAGARASQLRLELGVAYAQRGRFDDARRELDAAAAGQSSSTTVHLLRAFALDAAGRLEDAGRAFREAFRRDPANPVTAYDVLQRTRGLDAAEQSRARAVLDEAYRRLSSAPPSRTAPPFLLPGGLPDTLSNTPVVGDASSAEGFALLASGRFDEAVAALRGRSAVADRRSDESPLARFARGRRYEGEGRVAEARADYEAALAGTLAGRSALYVGIGRLAQVDGDLSGAVDAFSRAAALNPNDPVIRRELAHAYAAADRPDDAATELVAALLIDPGDPEVFAAIGQIHLDAGRAAEGVHAFRRALQLKPDRFETHYALGMAFSRMGREEDAAREFAQFERLSRQSLEQRRRVITGQDKPGESKR